MCWSAWNKRTFLERDQDSPGALPWRPSGLAVEQRRNAGIESTAGGGAAPRLAQAGVPRRASCRPASWVLPTCLEAQRETSITCLLHSPTRGRSLQGGRCPVRPQSHPCQHLDLGRQPPDYETSRSCRPRSPGTRCRGRRSPAPWRGLAGVPAGDTEKRRPARGEAADKEHRVTRRSLQGSEGNQTALPTPFVPALKAEASRFLALRPRCCLSGTRAPSAPHARSSPLAAPRSVFTCELVLTHKRGLHSLPDLTM